MRMSIRRWLAGLLFIAVPGWCAYADTVTIAASKDTTLYENNPANSNSRGFYFFAGRTVRGFGARRALLAFDIAGAVPAGSSIDAVSLQLMASRNPGTQDSILLSLHRLSADWGEGTSVAPALGGDGVAAETGDATWLHTFFASDLWNMPGGDFIAAPSATQMIAEDAIYVWDSTDSVHNNTLLISDVQSWLDNPATNSGWILKDDANNPVSSARRFNSRENSDSPPRLFISFTPPSAIPSISVWGLLLLAALLAAGGAYRLRVRPIN